MAVSLPLPCKLLTSQEKAITFATQQDDSGKLVVQTAPLGRFPERASFTLKWVGLSIAEKNTVINTLENCGTWGGISFIPYGEASPIIIRATKGYSQTIEGNLFTISCDFVRVEVL